VILFLKTWTNGNLILEEALDEASRNLEEALYSMCAVMELVQKIDFRVHIVLSSCRYSVALGLENLLSGCYIYF